MKYRAILFDLDGTLLPMEQEQFIKIYFGALTKKAAPFGYAPEKLLQTVLQGMERMIKNDGSLTNEEAFWSLFTSVYGEDSVKDKELFDDFYRHEFVAARAGCRVASAAAETVRNLKERGYRVALATNPVFPAVATFARIGWAGLKPDDFEFVTTYENSRRCKPNVGYYTDVCQRLNLSPRECLMVGNDVEEDGAALDAGMDVFFLTECLLNRGGREIGTFPQGGFSDLLSYIDETEKE